MAHDLNAVLIEDDMASRMVVEELVERTPGVQIVATFGDGLSALQFLKEEAVDVLFLDVELPDVTGLELLQGMKEAVPVVMISAKTDYAVESFRYSVQDYLVKPIKPLHFAQAIEKVRHAIAAQDKGSSVTSDFLFVRVDNQYHRVETNAINYVESERNQVLVCTDAKNFKFTAKISDLEKKLPADRFMRVHRSYIVNLSAVDVLQGAMAVVGKRAIPISRDQVQNLENRLNVLK